jgi:hypothetical protein
MNNTVDKKLEAMEKKDKMIFERLWYCKRTKCLKIMNTLEKKGKLYNSEVKEKCPRNKTAKITKRYLDCSTNIYKKSEIKNIYKNLDICSKKKCSKHEKTRKNLGKKLMKLYKKLK